MDGWMDGWMIVVTHDESTMTVCDKVYILEEGYIRVA